MRGLKDIVISRLGAGAGAGDFNAYSYSTTEGWINLAKTLKGPMPPACSNACFVSALGGSKIVLFGGNDVNGSGELGGIYVLDVATLTWTKGPDVSAEDSRTEAACAASGDYFIAWGGRRSIGNSTIMIPTALVYNLKTNSWTTTYIAPPSTDNPENSSNNGSSSRIVIMAAILGVVVTASLVAAALYYSVHRQCALNNSKNSAIQLHGPSSPEEYPPRNPHLSLVTPRGPKTSESQYPWPPEDYFPSHSPAPAIGTFQTFPQSILQDRFNSPQEGAISTQVIAHNPHAIVEDHSMLCQDGLNAYLDSSPI